MQKHKLFEVVYSEAFLTAHFIGSISAKKYQNHFTLCLKL